MNSRALLVVLLAAAACDGNPGFGFAIVEPDVFVGQGASVTLDVVLLRLNGFDAEVTATLQGLPVGVTTDPVVYSAGATERTFTIRAAADAPLTTRAVTARVSAVFDGEEKVFEFRIQVRRPPGTLDQSFGDDGIVLTPPSAPVTTIAPAGAVQLSDGRIIVCGTARDALGPSLVVAAYREDGQIDTSFGGGVVTFTFGGLRGTVLEILATACEDIVFHDGGLIVGAYVASDVDDDFGLVRFRIDGEVDTAFGETDRWSRTSAVGNFSPRSSGSPTIGYSRWHDRRSR